MKRALDIVAAVLGLTILLPLLSLVAVLVKCTSRGPALFRQERIGLGGRPFTILKFRSMVHDAPKKGRPITCGDDPRITRMGRFLRKTKIDELPQLVNVLVGEMSLVGPRPEIRRYVEMFRRDYDAILSVRPGITDLASIEYRDEAAILGQAADPDKAYIDCVLPEKIRLAHEYLRRQSLRLDIMILCGTLTHLVRDRMPQRRTETTREA